MTGLQPTMVQCPACQKDIPPLSSFCTFCGTRLSTGQAQQPIIAPIPGRVCLYCRFLIPQRSVFCPGCGRPAPLKGTMILGIISIVVGLAWISGNLPALFFLGYFGIARVLDSLASIGFLVAGVGLTQSRNPIVWWLSISVWATVLVRPLFTGITILSIIPIAASIIATTYLGIVSRYFLIGIGREFSPSSQAESKD